jgi:hypothetical protein
VILPGATSTAVAQKAEDIRSRVEALLVRYVDGNLPRITISVGVAAFPQSGDSPQTVFKAADEALYRAKENGRNRVELSASLGARLSSPTGPVVALHRWLAASFAAVEERSLAADERLMRPPLSSAGITVKAVWIVTRGPTAAVSLPLS